MNTSLAPLHIDGERLWQSLMDLAQIGATPKGGVCRIALTDQDKLGRDLVVQWFKEAGLTVRTDAVGNVFGRRAGTDVLVRAVATGSHIDTQPTGGKFDGNYGVMAGLEVVRTLNAHGIQTCAPIEVAFWTNEEGTRFTPVMMGSGAFAGVFGAEDIQARTDADGLTVGGSCSASVIWAMWPAAMCLVVHLPLILRPILSKVLCWRLMTSQWVSSVGLWGSNGMTWL